MALALDIANPQTPILNTLHDVLASPAKTEWLTAMKCKFDAIVLKWYLQAMPSSPWTKVNQHSLGVEGQGWLLHGKMGSPKALRVRSTPAMSAASCVLPMASVRCHSPGTAYSTNINLGF